MATANDPQPAAPLEAPPAEGLLAAIGVSSAAARYLGPARLTAARGDALDLALPDGRTAVGRSALAFPYAPAVGDELLVIGEAAAFYVIGVLRGSGATRLRFEGDATIEATGTLRVAAGEALRLDGKDVEVAADRLSIVADAASKIYGTVRQTVRELFTLRAKEHHTLVDGNVLQHSKSTRLVSEEKTTLNGKEIFLG